jgi:hypothetical protein
MIELSDLIAYIQQIFTPIAMISGLGLISLLTQARYGRIVDSMRRLNSEQLCLLKSLSSETVNEIEKKTNLLRVNNIDVQLRLFIKRSTYLKRALTPLLIGIFLLITSSILILGRELVPLQLMVAVTGISFVAGLFLLAIEAMFMIADLSLSQKAVIIDFEGIQEIKESFMKTF